MYTWWGDDGPHDVNQGESGEQGNLLMPVFYALAQHDALCDLDREAMFAFLDDVYIVARWWLNLPTDNQGLTGLGSLFGHDDFVARQLRNKRIEHNRLVRGRPHIDDLQATWLLPQQSCAALSHPRT